MIGLKGGRKKAFAPWFEGVLVRDKQSSTLAKLVSLKRYIRGLSYFFYWINFLGWNFKP